MQKRFLPPIVHLMTFFSQNPFRAKKTAPHWEPYDCFLGYATTPTTKQMIAQTMINAKSAYVTFFKMLAFVLSLFFPK